MIHEDTIQKLLELKLVAMAAAARELATSPPDQQLTPPALFSTPSFPALPRNQ